MGDNPASAIDARPPPPEMVLAAAREAARDFQLALSLLPDSFLALFGFEVRGKIRSRFTLFLDNRGVEVRAGMRPEAMLAMGFTSSAFYLAAEFLGRWWREGLRDSLLERMKRDPMAFAREFEDALDELRAAAGTIVVEIKDGRARICLDARLGEAGLRDPTLKISARRDDLANVLGEKLSPAEALASGAVRLDGDPSALLPLVDFLF